MNEIKTCEVCGNEDLTEVLDLGFQPLCDDLVPLSTPREVTKFPIRILLCPKCNTAHQKFQPSKFQLFPSDYHYRSARTPSVLKGMENLVSNAAQLVDLKGAKVLDVGCNDGSLLDFFKARGAITFGVDPTDAVLKAAESHKIWKGFFDFELSENIKTEIGCFDIICFTNVFAHIENLRMLNKSLRNLIDKHTLVIIENHYLGSVIATTQFDTFYHEHPRTYSLKSFGFIAESLGINLFKVDFPSRYGGNIRVYMSGVGSSVLTEGVKAEIDYSKGFSLLGQELKRWKDHTRSMIGSLVKEYGALDGIAFPGRASILINLLGLTKNEIRAIYEIKGSLKVFHYVPGTDIPILPEEELFLRAEYPKVLVNFAWHILEDVQRNMSSNGIEAELVNIKDPSRKIDISKINT